MTVSTLKLEGRLNSPAAVARASELSFTSRKVCARAHAVDGCHLRASHACPRPHSSRKRACVRAARPWAKRMVAVCTCWM